MRNFLSALAQLLAPGGTTPSSADGRSAERYRLAALNSLSNALSSAAGVANLLILVSLTLPALQPERFGIWMSVASVANVLMFLDLGVGNGLVNRVARARAVESAHRLRQIVARGLLLLTAMGLVAGVALMALTHLFSLDRLIRVSSDTLRAETRQTVDTFIGLFAIGLPLFGVQRVFFGLQHVWIVHLTRAAGYVVSPLFVYLLVQHDASIPWLLFATYGFQTLLPLALLPLLWRKLRPPRCEAPDGPHVSGRSDLRSLMGISSVFLALQIGSAIGWHSDALIAASVVGAAAVTPMVLVQRLFQFVTVPLSVVNTPLWVAYADAQARGDAKFLRQTLLRSMRWTLVYATVASVTLGLLAERLIALWLGPGQTVPTRLVVLFGIWVVLEALGHCISMYLNGRSLMKFQLIVTMAFCTVALPLKLWLPSTLGVDGIVGATVVGYVLCIMLPYAVFLLRHLRGTP